MRLVAIILMSVLVASCSPVDDVNSAAAAPETPIIIAHRGASGDLPEHTIEAYFLAIEQGADAIEPDLVMTKDGILIARHDLYLSTTTDIAQRPEFADRKREMDGRSDWWTNDLTLEEIRTLRAVQPVASRSREHDGLYMIPTFQEILDLGIEHNVMVIPEIKRAAYHMSVGLDPLPPFAAILRDAAPFGTSDMVVVQSFEEDFLRRMGEELTNPRAFLVSKIIADEVAATLEFSEILAPNRNTLFKEGASTGVVEAARLKDMPVFTWTSRLDDHPSDAEFAAEIVDLALLGVAGIFTDHPGSAKSLLLKE